jgi:putative phage-type endonuclease
VEQRSEEWFAARRGRVTGSAVGAILGLSPFMTADDVLRRMVREKFDAPSEFVGNVATDWGIANEPGAIIDYEIETGITVKPAGFYTHQEWLGASPDGLVGEEGLIEVKCPYSLRNAVKPVPFKPLAMQMHYYAQIQIQLFITGRPWFHIYQWTPAETRNEIVAYDNHWIESNMPTLLAFYQRFLVEQTHPMAERHLQPKKQAVDKPELRQLAAEYFDLVADMKAAEERKAELLEKIVQFAGGEPCYIAGHSLTQVQREGSISYSKVVKDYLPGVDLEPYRGKPTSYWTFK